MKELPLLFVCYLISSIHLSAQNCTQETLAKIPGKWIEGMKGSTGSTSATDLAKEKFIIGNIHKALQQAYKPMGLDADYNGIYYNTQDQYRWGNTYGYALRLMPYICTNNSTGKVHETSTSLTIAANNMAFGPEIYEPFIDSSPWDMGFRSINKLPVKQGNYYFYTEETGLGFGIRGIQANWLVTYDNKLPFLWVSRKEFLERRKQKLTQGRAQEMAQIKDSYKNDEKIQKEKLAIAMKGYDIALAKVEADLKMSASELSQQAIVKQDPNTVMTHLFTNADDPFAKILIKSNPDYFDKKLPRNSPQFFSIALKGNDKDLILGNGMKELEKALDFDALKNMLGK
ncbi:hypothetical protein [Emticicia sp. C21]|uniref:hypothetical protein n=1 Tax=Emticicia sp. C21 TaxID=2302915 RepID=UPI000E353119|nr:hypothetical protein [Emticicia sp. C21]RFS14975.1 hypothetical protein D0T08_17990 [Emticicia sp. C21]